MTAFGRKKNPTHKRPTHPRIGLLVGTWSEYGRGIIEGIWQYAQQHGPWLLEMNPSGADETTDLPPGWSGDGMIAAIQTRQLARKIKVLGIPVVNVSGSRRVSDHFPRVTSDAEAVVRMAVEHLLEKGLRVLAFCGEPHRPFIDFWSDAFRKVMVEMDMEPVLYVPSKKIGPTSGQEEHQKDRQRWLASLPQPAGVIGWATGLCRHLAMACAEGGLRVPEDISIISLETEDLLGRVIHPPLSGVDIPVRQIGYHAAAQLDRLLRGEPLAEKETRLPPLGVTTRQSTDIVACEDVAIQQAMRFIRDHAHEGINVKSILKAVPMARRSLERRFKEIIGRSPADEIRRTKIEKARTLLDTTDIPIPDVAAACGFNYVEHMIPIFRKHFGSTPARYRRNSRLGT
ncbi:MAG: substrate-binding domain-containing protein [Verrucomicrobiales bacterium]